MRLTGAEIVVQCLLEQGVDTVFGFPGGTILNVYDALYHHSQEIRHILTSHEQGAAHAADGYARASGKVGVCMATSGPGATNLVTGIATAFMDSIPMVAITCNVSLPLLGKDSFQEVDIAGITMPVTKHGYIVKDIAQLADTLRKAFRIARSGRPGPVLVDITKNVTEETAEYEPAVPENPIRISDYTEEDILRAVSMIGNSQKPYIYVGGGAVSAEASEELRIFVKKTDAPVCDTLMGKGAFDGKSSYYTGMIGMHGSRVSNLGVSECDLLLALGSRFDDRVIGRAKEFAPHAKVLHIDIDAAEINKNIKADHSLVGDLRLILQEINKRLKPQFHPEWMEQIRERKKIYPIQGEYDRKRLTAPMIIQKLSELTGGEAVVTTDVGQHQMWSAQYYTFRHPRSFLTSGGLGTMGYGLGACIGAKLARPDRTVINISGDGCFRMNMPELATASRYNIPIVDIIIDNHVLGMVRQWQTLFYDHRYSQTILRDKVDFCRVAEGLGCRALRVESPEELEYALKEALQAEVPFVLDCAVAEDDSVFPMVAPGKALNEAIDASDLKKE